jgi:UDP-glucose 4-epimerase
LRGEPLYVYGDGLQSRSFTYVSDAVRATLLAGERQEALGEAFNIGSLNEITIIDAAKRVLALTGSASTIHYQEYKEVFGPRFEDTRRRVPDTRKASDVLGFKAKITLEDGIRQTANWWSSVLNTSWGNNP